jgi:hypothetical protein
VYEMIARENPFFTLLAQHHVEAWLAEHEGGAGGGSVPQRRNG